MEEIKSKKVQDYVMNDMVWKVDMPRLLKEIAECSKSTPYPVTFTILARVLGILTVLKKLRSKAYEGKRISRTAFKEPRF